ncbi:hypothetical protein L9F63_016100, partial [Diploptera punctata]
LSATSDKEVNPFHTQEQKGRKHGGRRKRKTQAEMYGVEEDLRKLRVRGWRRRALDRDHGRIFGNEIDVFHSF